MAAIESGEPAEVSMTQEVTEHLFICQRNQPFQLTKASQTCQKLDVCLPAHMCQHTEMSKNSDEVVFFPRWYVHTWWPDHFSMLALLLGVCKPREALTPSALARWRGRPKTTVTTGPWAWATTAPTTERRQRTTPVTQQPVVNLSASPSLTP